MSEHWNFRHGHAASVDREESPTYASWHAMVKRCYNDKDPSYERYGGRGIQVCERWRGKGGFANFLSDVGVRPDGKTIDRFPDNDGNYQPGNVRWATRSQQSRHRRPSSNSGKLEEHEPEQIRWLKSLGYAQRSIASFFSVSEAMVSLIVNGKAWVG